MAQPLRERALEIWYTFTRPHLHGVFMREENRYTSSGVIDLTGQVFGRLTILYEGPRIRGRIAWVGRCECGNLKNTTAQNLRAGRAKSCGCLNNDTRKIKHITSLELEIYTRWKDMIQRCTNPKSKRFKDYGGRGTKVADVWLPENDGRTAFVTWSLANGYEKSLELDRRDNEEGYSPGNCRWVTRKENMRNTRASVYVELEGETVVLRDAIDKYRPDMHFSAVFDRIRRGWTVEEALFTPNTGRRTGKKGASRVGRI